VRSPRFASDHGAGDLGRPEEAGGFEFDLGAARGKFVQRDKSVGGIEAGLPTTSMLGATFIGNEWCARAETASNQQN